MENIHCLTDEETEVYEKLLNADAEETGVFIPSITNIKVSSPFINKTANATGERFKYKPKD